jgi:hypothetical protein
MGACFDSATFKACDEKTLKQKFAELQESRSYDNGSDAYAGHIGIARGLSISPKVFKDVKEAEDYVVENARKWENAIAVKVGDFSKIFPVSATEKKEVQKLEELQKKFDNWESDLLARVKQSKSAHRGCKRCGSKISVQYVKTSHCPVCSDMKFIETDTDRKNYESLRTKLKEQKEKVSVMSKKYDEKNKGNFWYVGAWCAS